MNPKRTCPNCGKVFETYRIRRIYGRFSTIAILGYCTSTCFVNRKTEEEDEIQILQKMSNDDTSQRQQMYNL